MRLIILISILPLLFLPVNTIAQDVNAGLKREAINHMRYQRYGEAIDLLNKYISANARGAEGYHLRGLCREKREEYQYSVLDLRRAVRLDGTNQKYREDLSRVLAVWHRYLRKKIDGYKREIAIDPSYPFNYLEIGKCHRWLEEWKEAEIWYDKYLALDDNASPDEIIRYTEILAKTGSISKGERILKKFVDRYPDDWRLWSRYGYFTMWLGNYRNAERAFQNALGFKPFFKEAQDGLDIARREGYLTKYVPRAYEKVYPIDRYYRLIKKNPDDDETRFALVADLIKADRDQEAYEQLQILKEKYEGTPRYEQLKEELKNYQINKYSNKLNESLVLLKEFPTDAEATKNAFNALMKLERFSEAKEILSEYLDLKPDDNEMRMHFAKTLSWYNDYEMAEELLRPVIEKDPYNKEAIKMLAGIYAEDYDYDTALEILGAYVERFEENEELDVRYLMGKYYAWNYQWDDARLVTKSLVENDPTNNEYKLLAGQVIVWTVDQEEFPKAEGYFTDILAEDEKNLYAILGMCTIRAWERNLPGAKEYLDMAKKYHPDSPETITIENFYNSQVLVQAEREAMNIRAEAGKLAQEGDCPGAVAKYEEYFAAVDNPEKQAYLEFASANICAGNYSRAEGIYDELLNTAYDFDVALARGKLYIWQQDSVKAMEEMLRLKEEDPQNFDVRMFLGDAYRLNREYSEAEDLYDELLDETQDSMEIRMLEDRLRLIPPYGLSAGLRSFWNFIVPTNLAIIPSASFYKDNQDLMFYRYGSRAELGMLRYFSFGIGLYRTHLESENLDQILTDFRGNATLFLSDKITLGYSYGKTNIENEAHKYNSTVSASYKEGDKWQISFSYEDNDSRVLFYSPRLINKRSDSYLYSLFGKYDSHKNLYLEGAYRYFIITAIDSISFFPAGQVQVAPGNIGNDFRIKLGKYFNNNTILAGYEFYFADYGMISDYYYSPEEFDTHSIWLDWFAHKDKELEVKLGGKIGYSPAVDYIISDIHGELLYEPIENFRLSAQAGLGNSYRFDSSYKYFSASISAYWGIY